MAKEVIQTGAPIEPEPDAVVNPELTKMNERYGNLKTKFDEQGNEIGTLRTENATMKGRLSEVEKQALAAIDAAKEEEPSTDYEKQITDIRKNFEDGEIDEAELTTQVALVTAEQTKAQVLEAARQETQEILAERDKAAHDDENDKITKEFKKNNPEFAELQQSGELEKIKAENPMHDDFSAYYDYMGRLAELKGRDKALREKDGAKDAGKVLGSPGSEITETNKTKKLSGQELEDSMMKAMDDAV